MLARNYRGVFKAQSELANHLIRAVRDVQKHCSARILEPNDCQAAAQTAFELPFGSLHADGGAVPNSYKYIPEATHLIMSWWRRRRGEVDVHYVVKRDYARRTSYGGPPRWQVTTGPEQRQRIWREFYPERAQRLDHLLAKRAVRHLPPPPPWLPMEQLRIRAREGNVVAIEAYPDSKPKHYEGILAIATPAGWIACRYWHPGVDDLRKILKLEELPVPRTRKEPLWNRMLEAHVVLRMMEGSGAPPS